MKAVVMNEYGGPEVLKFTDYPDPTPGPGEVLIRVAAASINPIDLLQRSGATKDFFPVEFPGIIGRDVSGTVLELGAGVERIFRRRQGLRFGVPYVRGALYRQGKSSDKGTGRP
jgi:NADPH:quinone reductase-like Zn-dependent oxidoreductase